MKLVLYFSLAAVVLAAPNYWEGRGSNRDARILKHDFISENDGTYVLGFETSNGIVTSQSGAPSGPAYAVRSSGYYSYTAPDGTPVHVKYVADENGYQPESSLLPVAPEFPHPIPDFVLAQIEKAAEEDRNRPREYYYD